MIAAGYKWPVEKLVFVPIERRWHIEDGRFHLVVSAPRPVSAPT